MGVTCFMGVARWVRLGRRGMFRGQDVGVT